MRWLVLCTLVLCLASSAWAVNTGNKYIAPVKDAAGDGMVNTRQGGESYDDAFVIPLPGPSGFWSDSGATCGMRDDIMPSCVSSTAPDAVYMYAPTEDMELNIDLCGSGYDTAMEIQDGIGVPLLCNDDFCGLQSGFEHVAAVTGHTYYVIVDGYSTSCGSYILNIERVQPCVLPCPADAWLEGEPECGPNYVDAYNGGCNSVPNVFQNLCPDAEGSRILCGKSGTYSYYGLTYRDTDWFQVYGTGGIMTVTLGAEFASQLLFIYGADCGYLQYASATAGQCEYAVLGRMMAPMALAWIWVGPGTFSGVPCDKDYVLQIDGFQNPITATDNSNWGEIKNLFR